MDIRPIIQPSATWRYYIVYWRRQDGRIWFFRGGRRRALFVANLKGDWVGDEERARLFEIDPPQFEDRNFVKALRSNNIRNQIHFEGFKGIVQKTHLIIPAKPRSRTPPG